MKKRLGVEMTVLGEDDRTNLMDGMFLRRLVEGSPLTEHQLQTAIVQDMVEITRRFSTFDFETYVGCCVNDFLTVMEEFELIASEKGEAEGEEDPPTIYSRGRKADEFISGLTEEMGWMVEDLPMSTRGVFDSLKSRPGRKVTMSRHDYLDKHRSKGEETKEVVEDDRHDFRDRQLQAGPGGN